MTGFGPFNFQQSAQQRSQQFHREASQRAIEMHQQAHQRAQQSAQSLQRLQEMQQQQQHQQWLDNLKAGYWADQQRRKQQEGQCARYSLLGPVLPSGYEAWVGTSFSAPLVLDKGNGSLSPEDVSAEIEASAESPMGSDLPTGIISVTGSPQP